MANKKMKFPTFDWDKGKKRLKDATDDLTYAVPFSDADGGKQHYGMRITPEAYVNLVKQFADEYGGASPFEIVSVTFSKASLFRVLSQPDCEYVRFHFAFPEKAKLSLILEGVGKDLVRLRNDLVMEVVNNDQRSQNSEDPDYEEKGNGGEAGYTFASEAYKKLLEAGALEFVGGSEEENKRQIVTKLLQAIDGR